MIWWCAYITYRRLLFNGEPLLSVWPGERTDDETRQILQRSHSIGTKRTPAQDIFFLVDELVEIAARALSTGVNDPYTAMTCVDWFGAAAAEVSRRQVPSERRADGEGVVRVIAMPQSIAAFYERGFGRMRQYVARDMNAASHTLDTLRAVGVHCDSAELRQALADQAERLLSLAEEELHGPSLAQVREHYRQAVSSLETGSPEA